MAPLDLDLIGWLLGIAIILWMIIGALDAGKERRAIGHVKRHYETYEYEIDRT